MPWYVTYFALSMLLTSFFPVLFESPLPVAGKYLLTVAMASIGLQINLKKTFQGSPKPLILGGLSCFLFMGLNIVISFLL